MKIKMYLLISVYTSAFAFAQTNKKTAKKENQEKFASTNIKTDVEFAVTAFDAGLYESQLADLGKLNVYSAKAIDLTNKMIYEHYKANQELALLASKKSITIPTALSEKRKKEIISLLKFDGPDFDKAYLKKVVNEYSDIIELFQKETDQGKDNDLKDWAVKQIPILKNLLDLAQIALESIKETEKR